MNKIICLKGDGIGPEIMDSSIKILEEISKDFNFEYEMIYEDFGGASIDKNGIPFIIHHASPVQRAYEEDILEVKTDIIGHYRY